jgi:hypothetical protein
MEQLKFFTWWRIALMVLITFCCVSYIIQRNYSAAIWVFYYLIIWVLWQKEHVEYMNSLRAQIDFLQMLRTDNEAQIDNLTNNEQ